MIIEDTMYKRDFSISTKNAFSSGLELLEVFSRLGELVEKKTEYLTDGPRKEAKIEFDIIKNIDDFSSLVFSFTLFGEDREEKLYADIKGFLRVQISDENFFSKVFAEYYFLRVFRQIKKIGIGMMREQMAEIENEIMKISKESYT